MQMVSQTEYAQKYVLTFSVEEQSNQQIYMGILFVWSV